MRKKIVAILLAATMAIGITACGNQSESNKEAKKTIIQLQYGVGTKHLIFLQWKKLQKFIKKIIKM